MNDLFYSFLVAVSAVIVASCIVVYLFLKQRHQYWKNLGIPGPEPKFLLGNTTEQINLELTEAEICDRYYKEYKNEEFIGLYRLWQPVLLVRDYDLVKKIMEKDFDSFANRPGFTVNAKTDSIMIHLFSLEGHAWKSRRTALTKLFTPKKLKEYMDDMQTALSCLVTDLEAKVGGDVSLGPIVRKYVVTSVCMEMYGMDVSKDKERIAKFCDYADIFSRPPTSVFLKAMGMGLAPMIFKLFKIPVFPAHLYEYFEDLLNSMMDERVRGKVTRQDALEAIMQMKDVGFSDKEKISLEEAVGHIYVLFQASFDTTKLTICHSLLQLALNPEAQDRARQEVDSVLKGSKEITYDHISQMSYLDGVVCETLRIQPSVGVLSRVCTKPYKINDKVTIPKGTMVNIPVASLHMDPAFYPEPERFQPERFSHKEDGGREPWLPFGIGPRACIGLRLGKASVKLVLAKILSQYNILQSDKMKLPMKFDPKTLVFTVRPVEGFWIKLQKRD